MLNKNTKSGAEIYHMKQSKSIFTSEIQAADIQGAMIKDSRP